MLGTLRTRRFSTGPAKALWGMFTKDLVPVDSTQIHRWSERESKRLVEKIGKDRTLSKIFDHQKMYLRSIKVYKALGKFVSNPEDTAAVLDKALSSKSVDEATVKAWCTKLGSMEEKFEVRDGYNVTAEKDACSGQWRGALQVTTLPTGKHEVLYCVTGVQLKTAAKIKEWKENSKPVLGKKSRTFEVTKKGWFGPYKETVCREEDVVIDYEVERVPVYFPDAVEQDVYELVKEVLARDVSLEFFDQYGAVLAESPTSKPSSWTHPKLLDPLFSEAHSAWFAILVILSASVSFGTSYIFMQPEQVQIVVSQSEAAELQELRAQNLNNKGSATSQQSQKFDVRGNDADASAKRVPASQESKVSELPYIQSCGLKDIALPKDSEKDFADMLPITLKSGEKGDSVRDVVETLYKLASARQSETDDHTAKIKMHPDWRVGGGGLNHIVWVPREDASMLKSVYKSNDFQRFRREFESKHDRRAPRLTFHEVLSTSSPDRAGCVGPSSSNSPANSSS